MTYLLDTCILSKLRRIKRHPDRALENWICRHEETKYYLSVLTIGEIQNGISRLSNAKDKRILEEWLRGDIVPRFKGRIKNFDLKVALKWGEINGCYQKRGVSIPVIDGLIAATAIAHDFILVTENVKDFCNIDELNLFSPWEYQYL
ncbi:MAG: type II toxin-antitoxin system VapC family toxin [Chlamydiales bacterium]|nr:type II toxin-antitoxin system VapC family toxin [Chlamydiales bacterium]